MTIEMKKVKLLAACMICSLIMSAQSTNYLQITLYKNLLLGSCNLSQDTSNVVYIHSGAGYKTMTSLWDVVVGNWGKADGIGKMTTVNDSTYTICMDISKSASNYYTVNPTDSGPLPIGSTIYNIGCVFRDQGPFPLNAQGQPILNLSLKGAANDNCSDIWIEGVNTGTISIVEQFDGATPVSSVTANYVSGCATGVHDISNQLMDEIKVWPNPFTDMIRIQFNMIPDLTKVHAQVYDVMGRTVADFTPGITGGFNYFTWDGTDVNGSTLPAGTYLLKVTNGSQIQTKKLIKL